MTTEAIANPELEHALLPLCRDWREKVASLGADLPRCPSVVEEFWEAVAIIQQQPPMSRAEYVALYGRPFWELESEMIDAECNALDAELKEACERARVLLRESGSTKEPKPEGPEYLVLEALGEGRLLALAELEAETGLDRDELYQAVGNLLAIRSIRTNPSGWYWLSSRLNFEPGSSPSPPPASRNATYGEM